ncbi:MAG: dihydrofolate reductase [gamma proteobacterium symbiont of Ctena orbiculata]|uniref:Dihydrofolate reductase n=1 Tax=Candidatus Thiodiazotropha taylori TaxID=2792791 RepID=A0A944M5Q1_9GAMM|nr:type 3 dihydrofolate reductase [Candidatus Thiodiazotropha taylori]PUB82639.1 MAG: type 3 dihydrofolate reductase [gamma proteobacterium symbiont of Ctena orbiculata]MBT2987583.1 type 3 dihydrofolate reductase [Candidatus Thiodiazotropha taylori]MBT2995161.1 type 3 dihydrofolate reductase [Candidatus Thiodiazotropha taylori]MBT2999920.1 type 3 dihydrofolate reductase [Candidatus Thiodiazotropha taylori]
MKPLISLIAAVANNGVIGVDNSLPWRLPADLKHFKALTMGKPIVMGRRTWESLPGVLPGRRHIVVSRNRDYRAEGCELVHSVDEALQLAGDAAEIMIVGGGGLYRQMLPRADRLYLTLVEADVEGDAYFPEIDWSQWHEVSRETHAADDRNLFAYSFVILNRISP